MSVFHPGIITEAMVAKLEEMMNDLDFINRLYGTPPINVASDGYSPKISIAENNPFIAYLTAYDPTTGAYSFEEVDPQPSGGWTPKLNGRTGAAVQAPLFELNGALADINQLVYVFAWYYDAPGSTGQNYGFITGGLNITETAIGKVSGTVSGMTGSCPGSGTIDLYSNATGCLSTVSQSVTAKNICTQSIPVGTWVNLIKEPFSEDFFCLQDICGITSNVVISESRISTASCVSGVLVVTEVITTVTFQIVNGLIVGVT
jgi:hypothetical protein